MAIPEYEVLLVGAGFGYVCAGGERVMADIALGQSHCYTGQRTALADSRSWEIDKPQDFENKALTSTSTRKVLSLVVFGTG